MISAHSSNINLNFYNDRVKEVMDAGIMAEPFTYVPPLAGHMELVGGNAVVFGKITEGYDEPIPIVEVEVSYQEIASESAITGMSVINKQLSVWFTELPEIGRAHV